MYIIGQEEKDAVARIIDSKELFMVNGHVAINPDRTQD